MLILKACVNLDQIDEIHVHNTGGHTENGKTIYRIVKPTGLEDEALYHYRDNGWQPLAIMAIQRIMLERRIREAMKDE